MKKDKKLKMPGEEFLVVVDEDNNEVGYLPRGEVHKRNLLHRTVSVVVFNSKGELLLQQRSMNLDTYPGMFGNAVGGHAIKGETFEEAARKETIEELGLDIPFEFVKVARIKDPNHPTMTALHKAIADGPFNFQKEEIISLKFFPLDEVRKMKDRLSPPTKLILKELGIITSL